MTKKVALFADVQNIYYTTRQAYRRQFDYNALWRDISHEGDIHCAYAYAIDRADEKQRKFQSALHNIGFTIKLKPYIQRSDGSAKGDWDVGITIDVMETAQQVDTIVLLSGDGDFDLLLDKVRVGYAKEAIVYGVPSLTADSLISAASAFRPINESMLL